MAGHPFFCPGWWFAGVAVRMVRASSRITRPSCTPTETSCHRFPANQIRLFRSTRSSNISVCEASQWTTSHFGSSSAGDPQNRRQSAGCKPSTDPTSYPLKDLMKTIVLNGLPTLATIGQPKRKAIRPDTSAVRPPIMKHGPDNHVSEQTPSVCHHLMGSNSAIFMNNSG